MAGTQWFGQMNTQPTQMSYIADAIKQGLGAYTAGRQEKYNRQLEQQKLAVEAAKTKPYAAELQEKREEAAAKLVTTILNNAALDQADPKDRLIEAESMGLFGDSEMGRKIREIGETSKAAKERQAAADAANAMKKGQSPGWMQGLGNLFQNPVVRGITGGITGGMGAIGGPLSLLLGNLTGKTASAMATPTPGTLPTTLPTQRKYRVTPIENIVGPVS